MKSPIGSLGASITGCLLLVCVVDGCTGVGTDRINESAKTDELRVDRRGRPRRGTGGAAGSPTGGTAGSSPGGAAGMATGGSAPVATGGATGGGGAGGSATSGTGGATATGWRPFNDSSPWNVAISAGAALDPDSAAMIADFSTISGQDTFWINIQDDSVPVYYVDSTTTPAVTVLASLGATGFRTGSADDSVDSGTGLAPIPTQAMPALGSDAHLLIVDKQAQKEWGFYFAAKTGSSWKAELAATLDLAGTGVRPPEHDAPWWAGHGPRACGFGLANGLITMDDIRAGRIEHALMIAYPHIRSRYYTAPASSAQSGIGADAIPTRGVMCGGRIQLDPSVDVSTLGLSATGLMIARALQQYGAYVGDYSGAVSLYADESADAQTYWKSVGLNNNTAERIPLQRFRVIQSGTTYDNMN